MATTCTVNLKSEVREVSNKDTEGGWVENRVVAINWQVTAECVIDPDATYGVTVDELEGMVGTTMQVEFATASGDHNAAKGEMLLSGYAILSDVNITAQNRQRGTCAITMTGQGGFGVPMFLADSSSVIFETSDGYLLVVK